MLQCYIFNDSRHRKNNKKSSPHPYYFQQPGDNF